MKIFISQAMTGRKPEDIIEERKLVSRVVKEKYGDDAEVIDSYLVDAPEDANDVWYIGESIILLSKADLVVFVPGWERSKGCGVERYVIEHYDIPYVYLSDLMKP